MIKHLIQAAFITAALASCAGLSTGGHHGIPSSAEVLARDADKVQRSVVERKEEIIAHYDADGNLTAEAVKGGFYRVFHGRDKQGRAVVQDFYQDSRTKQIDPSVIPDDEKIKSFAVEDSVGRTIWYSREGELRSFADIENGRAVRSGYYIKGQLRFSVYEPDEKRMYKTSYHENGRPKVKFTADGQAESYTVYDSQGKVLGVSDAKNTFPAADSAEGKLVREAVTEFFELHMLPNY